MKTKTLLLLLLNPFIQVHGQDSTEKWQPFFAGVIFNSVPVNSITGKDTGYANALSIAPYIAIRSRSGWGIKYSPRIVSGASKSGVYLHQLSAGVSQYDKPLVNYEAQLSHYFFSNNTSVPYSPLSNEFYGSFTYKKPWLAPMIATSIGFGHDTTSGNPKSAYDVGLAIGISHAFNWDGDALSCSLIPKLLMNAGTNQYFSFLNVNKFVGNSKHFLNYVKTIPGTSTSASATGRGRGRGSTTTTTTTTTTSSSSSPERFELSNFEIGFDGEIDWGHFAARPEASIFIPAGTAAGSNVFGYWQLTLEYNF
ncbi:MAG: hypothetical protein JST58_02730 [Bacteroidetes bacterium]|nr:hypothetical protein [Bacteroidota bacterium]